MPATETQPSPAEETPEIVLRLERYEDIFSDFDIRPYSRRSLSVDFIDEVKRAASDKSDGKIELVLLMPEAHKDEHHETVIKERLASHFKKHYNLLSKERGRIRRLGVKMVVTGIVCLIAATFVLFKNLSRSFLFSFLVVLLEPAAWFLLWEGMDQIIFTSKSVNPDLNFYRKMSHPLVHISFKTY